MTKEFVFSLIGYFETLYIINQKIITLFGMEFDGSSKDEKIIVDMIQDISRIVPYKYRNKKIQLNNRDGLLEFESETDFLIDGYEKIIKENYFTIDNIRIIRNKYEHKVHAIKSVGARRSNDSFAYAFEIEKNKKIVITSIDILKLIKELNILFSKIQDEVGLYAYNTNNGQYRTHAYFERINRFYFIDFNKIYDSNILRIIGKATLGF